MDASYGAAWRAWAETPGHLHFVLLACILQWLYCTTMVKSALAREPEVAAQWVDITALRPWAENPRKNDGEPVKKVAASIKRFGFASPIIARKNGEIIAGHTRWKAARSLGLTRVPVRYMDLDPTDARLLALADNRVAEEAAWDDGKLSELLVQLEKEGVDLSCSGFDESELTKLLKSADVRDVVDDECVSRPDELLAKWKVSVGDVWRIYSRSCDGGSHVIMCGDSTSSDDVRALVGDKCADMMWTDPPYGVSYVGKTSDALEIQNDKLKPAELEKFLIKSFSVAPLRDGAAVYVAHPPGALSLQFRLAFDKCFTFRQGLVWVKDSLVLGRSDYHYKHEPIMYGNKKMSGRFGRGGDGWNGDDAQVSVFDVARPKTNREHPTMKPIELVEIMIRNSTTAGQCVYEPFSGSGTTLIACESTARICFAMELDPRFVAVALERMSALGMTPERV